MSTTVGEPVVYDSGALIAIDDRRNRTAMEDHAERVAQGQRIFVPTVVAAQVVRSPATQAALMLTLRGCSLVPFTAAHHMPVGQLLAKSGTADVVDAFVAVLAATLGAAVICSDPDDIAHLLGCLDGGGPVLPV
jgi:hypothetical protein